jgi:hypothetical protein
MYKDIKDDLAYINNIYVDFKKITDSILIRLNYPDYIKELIKDDYKLFENIIDFYYNDVIVKINNKISFNDIIYNISNNKLNTDSHFIDFLNKTFIKASDDIIISIGNNFSKNKFIHFSELIIKWFISIKFVETIFDNEFKSYNESESEEESEEESDEESDN